MNDENLQNGKATQFQSGDKAARSGKKGGIRSGQVRRARKAVKEMVLDAIYTETETGSTVLEEMIGGVIRRAIKAGDPSAFEKIMEYADKSPKRKREEEELKIKREAVGKASARADIEDLSILAELINGTDADDQLG